VAIALGLAACRGGETTDRTDTEVVSSQSSSTTQAADGSGSATSSSMKDDLPPVMPDFPPPPHKLCSLEVIDPTADLSAAIDMGDGRGQIPTVIGEALLRNCGCHYTNNVVGYVDYKSDDKVPLGRLADFHVDFVGTFPKGFRDMPVYKAVEARVIDKQPLPMPPIECSVDDEPGTITAVDVELFARWLSADAPDGATFR
jgi:hypothetical protein